MKTKYSHLGNNWLIRFLLNRNGDTSMQFALVFGAFAIACALMVPLLLNGNSRFASSNTIGIDRTVTGSIDKPVKRYHIRRSVLDNEK